MGTYIYTVRRSKPVHVLVGNEWIDAYRVQFLRKPRYDWWSYDRITTLGIGRAWHAWANHGVKGRIVINSDSPSEGDRVYRWNSEGPVWEDGGAFPGEFLGILVPFNGAFRCQPMSKEEYAKFLNRQKLPMIRAGESSFHWEGEMITGPEAATLFEERFC